MSPPVNAGVRRILFDRTLRGIQVRLRQEPALTGDVLEVWRYPSGRFVFYVRARGISLCVRREEPTHG